MLGSLLSRLMPRVPITITSALISSATSPITKAGLPSLSSISQGTPACSKLARACSSSLATAAALCMAPSSASTTDSTTNRLPWVLASSRATAAVSIVWRLWSMGKRTVSNMADTAAPTS